MSKWKILHVCETLPGGPSAYLDEVLPHQLSQYGAGSVQLIMPRCQSDTYSPPRGVSVRYFGGRSRLIRSLFLSYTLFCILLRGDSVLVHLHSTYAGFFGRLFYPLFKRKCAFVYCAHGWAFDRPSSALMISLLKRIECTLAKYCDRVICISKHEFKSGQAIGILPEKLVLIRNGVSNVASVPRMSDKLYANLEGWAVGTRLLFVGRLDKQKGLDILLAAMDRLPQFQLVVVGSAVVDNSRRVQPQSNVRFLGWRNRTEVNQLMRECDYLVVPSRWEGFGLVAAEAMRFGKPIIASRTGGLVELVVDGVTGILVESGSVTALADGILACSTELSSAAQVAARRFYEENFTAERMNIELDSLYSSLVASKFGIVDVLVRA